MKKIIVASLALAFLLTGSQSVLAASPFNGQSGDCGSIGIGNYTKNNIPRDNNGCWTSKSISADAGDTINVAIYYHNNTNSTLNNVSGSVVKSSSGPSNNYTFTGKMYSDQGDQTLGTVSLNLSSSQSLTYSSTHIMKGASAILNDQDTSVVNNDDGQISIGSVPPGWNDYGEILVVFKVGTTVVQPNYCSISNFTTNTSSITSGNSATLSWNTSDCTSVTVYPTVGNTNLSGSQTVYPTTSTTYTLTAYGSTGSAQTRTVTVSVNQISNYCSISNFTTNTSSITSGNSATLSWNTSDCTSVTVYPTVGNTNLSGSQTVYPTTSTTYTLTAYGSTGSAQTRTVTVSVENTYTNTPSVSTYSPSNILTTSATLSGYTNGNGSTINSWIEFPCYGTKYDNRYNQSSSTLSYNISYLSPSTTYSYCVAAQNNNGQIYRGNAISFTTPAVIQPVVYIANSNVVTTVATNVSNNGATINGYITNPNYYNTNVYFEYGTSVGLGSRTISKQANSVSAFNEMLTSLSPDTIYFFRAVSEGSNGTSKGTIEIFRTLGATVVRPIIIQGTTVIGNQSPIMLKIENRYPLIGEGDTVDYTVTYKNIGKTTLVKPILQVIVPKGITLTNSTKGTYSSDTNTLTVPLEDLIAGAEGTVNVEGKVVSLTSNSSQIVSTAVLVYTNKDGAQENAMAYVLNSPKTTNTNNSLLGASAFFGGIFPTSLIGWLMIIIFIMIIVMIARNFYRKQPAHVSPSGETH